MCPPPASLSELQGLKNSRPAQSSTSLASGQLRVSIRKSPQSQCVHILTHPIPISPESFPSNTLFQSVPPPTRWFSKDSCRLSAVLALPRVIDASVKTPVGVSVLQSHCNCASLTAAWPCWALVQLWQDQAQPAQPTQLPWAALGLVFLPTPLPPNLHAHCGLLILASLMPLLMGDFSCPFSLPPSAPSRTFPSCIRCFTWFLLECSVA